LVPHLGTDPSSAPYQEAVLPLNERGVVLLLRIELSSAAYKTAASPAMLERRFFLA